MKRIALVELQEHQEVLFGLMELLLLDSKLQSALCCLVPFPRLLGIILCFLRLCKQHICP